MSNFRLRHMREEGISLVIVAVSMFVFLAIAGLAIDMSYVYFVKNELQVAVDAAALAGASRLTDPNDTVQTAALDEARVYAAKNKVSPEEITELSVGYWDGAQYQVGGYPINAVKVRAKKTAPLSFGKMVEWPAMSPSAEAIAADPPIPTAPIPFCLNVCSYGGAIPPTLFKLQQDTAGVITGMAWSEYRDDRSTPIGEGTAVVSFIRQQAFPSNICGACITTNNGVGFALQALKDEFESRKGADGRWEVIIPVINTPCSDPALQACPPGYQPDEPFKIENLARVYIADVVTQGSDKGIVVDYVRCANYCGDPSFLGLHYTLVK